MISRLDMSLFVLKLRKNFGSTVQENVLVVFKVDVQNHRAEGVILSAEHDIFSSENTQLGAL